MLILSKSKKLIAILLTLNKPKKSIFILLTLNKPKKFIVALLRIFDSVETFLQCEDFYCSLRCGDIQCCDFSTMCLYCSLRCEDFQCKELLTGFELFLRVGKCIRSCVFHPFGHRALQSMLD